MLRRPIGRGAAADPAATDPFAAHLLPTREKQATHAPESKLGGFNARFAVSTAYQMQLQLISVSTQDRFKAL